MRMSELLAPMMFSIDIETLRATLQEDFKS